MFLAFGKADLMQDESVSVRIVLRSMLEHPEPFKTKNNTNAAFHYRVGNHCRIHKTECRDTNVRTTFLG